MSGRWNAFGVRACAAYALLAVCLSLTVHPALAESKKIEREETWQVIYMSGQRIGYATSTIEPVTDNGRELVRTSTIISMTIKRFGQSLSIKQTVTTEETIDGDLLRFTYETANPPASSSLVSGVVDKEELKIKDVVNGREKETTKAWRTDVKSPTFQDRALRDSPMKPGDTRSFDAFMPEFKNFATIKLAARDYTDTPMLDGMKKRLLRIDMSVSLLPGTVTQNFVDEKNETRKTSTNMLGIDLITYEVDKDEALKAISGAELDLAVSTLIKIDKRIPEPHSTRKIVYKVTTPGQNPESVFPSGDSQKVSNVKGESAELTVTSIPIPARETVPVTDDKAFLESTQYLQADDERVVDHARKASGDATDHAQIARRMEEYVNEKLNKKNFSTAMASAGEVARNLEGDCTEHAVLLAAMLRAKGIPSRVVVGVVYVDKLKAFGGHMWTEAKLNSRWVPLDATLGRGGIGAAHLKLADSGLSDDGPTAIGAFAPLMQVIGQLKIEVVSIE